MASTPLFAGEPYALGVTFVNADGTTAKIIAQGTTAHLYLRHLWGSNDDSGASYGFDFFLRKSAVDYRIARVTLPVSAGAANGVPAVNLVDTTYLPGIFADPNTGLWLHKDVALVAKPVSAVAALKTVTFVALGGLE